MGAVNAPKIKDENNNMTIGDWDKLLEETPWADLIKYKKALETLQSWPKFNEEFKWTRIFVLISCIDQAMDHQAAIADGKRTPRGA